MKRSIAVIVAMMAGCMFSARAQSSPQPVPVPQTFGDVVQTVEWMYIEIVAMQSALSNQQKQLTAIEVNPVLTLGGYMKYTPPAGGKEGLELFSGVNITIQKGLFRAN